MLHVLLVIIAVIVALFLLMLPMHMRTGRFHWVPPKMAGESEIEKMHRRLHEGFENEVLSAPGGEGFEGAPLASESAILEFRPDTPAPADLSEHPYHLLGDWFPAAKGSKPMGAGACYKADYEQQHNCTRNFEQKTNNYKRDYPDSCSGSPQDFTLQFYSRA
jgi:hypothetical protein